MDLDHFIARNRPVWDRLDALTARAGRHPRSLSAQELQELVRLYLRTSSHLATARSVHGDPALVTELTTLVGRARAAVYGTRSRTFAVVAEFFTTTFPAAVWHARMAILASVLVFVAVSLPVGVWLATSDAAVAAAAPGEVVDAYVEQDFEAYYSSQPAGQFATLVFTNNVQVAALAFATGILLCVPTALVIGMNGANLGLAAGLFAAAGQAPRFWGLILPHGLLELTAVFVAGAAGLRLGWALIDPGDRRRSDALADQGQRSVVIVLGLILVFGIAGVIEAFVTPSALTTWARVGVGVVVEAAFLTYLVVLGRSAARQGRSGTLAELRPSPGSTLEAAGRLELEVGIGEGPR